MQKAYFSLILSLLVTLGSFAQTTKVDPLLKDINWGQRSPYNDQCPQQLLAGCGAIAAGQIMKFHGFAKGIGKVTNTGETFDLSQATYDWSKILPFYNPGTSDEKSEVAKLVRHIGAAMGTTYNETGSGASLNSLRNALITNFGYKATANIIYRVAYTDDEWFDVIKREIDVGRPVAYSGDQDKVGGHLFVCDGYDTSNKTLHFNYGWNGSENNWHTVTGNRFNKMNKALIGLHYKDAPTDPTVAMYTPLNFSNYAPNLNTTFDIAVSVANLGFSDFNNDIGVALYNGDKQLQILKTIKQALTSTSPEPSGDKKPLTYNIFFTDVIIPDTIADGKDHQLRLVVKSATGSWCPALGLSKDVVKEANLSISKGVANITYPLGKDQLEMVLTKPIEINVANNRAVANFTIRNTETDYDFSGDIFVVVSPNNKLIPTTWKKITVDIPRELSESFEISNIEVPAGADVKSCRFSVAYSRKLIKFGDPDADREVACVPLMPANFNLKTYQIPNVTELSTIDFTIKSGKPIPDNYKMYNPDGSEDSKRETWGKHPQLFGSYAAAITLLSKLVTSAIPVSDENDVLELKYENPFKNPSIYRIYISTKGQDYNYFKELTPIYNDSVPNYSIARVGLSEYAGDSIYIMLERVSPLPFELTYIKTLNIKSPKDISIQDVNIPGSSLVEESFPVKVSVKNHSAANVKKVKATYTVEGLPSVTEEIATNIPFNMIKELTFSTPVTLNGDPGKQTKIELRVEQDGEEAEYKNNNSGSATHMLVDFYPKKNIVLFKSSKLKCGPCGKTYSVIDEVDKLIPEGASGVEVWKDGIFAHPDFSPYATGETPTFFANGRVLSGHATWNVPGETNKAYKKMTPPAEVSVKADYENEGSRKLKIKITCRFAAPLKGDYKLGAYIIENNIINTIGEIAGSHPAGELLTKNHMPIATVGGSKGYTGFLITNPEAKTYEFDCEYTVPDKAFTRAINKNNVQVIGLLFSSTGEILNSALNSHYIFLPKTEGLTFIAQEGGSPFEKINEVGFVNDMKYISLENYRSTIPTDSSFKFKVTKNASWNGKILRMRVNPDADYNKDKGVEIEQVLLPDENGVYTIDKMNMNYYMRVDTANSSKPLVDKRGSLLVLSGTWTLVDFNTKLNLSSASLTRVDMTGIKIPEDAPALNAANPNLLIYTDTDAKVPVSWKNVVAGTSAGSITLEDGYSFYNSKAFTATAITYTREYPSQNWVSGCLPFAVSSFPVDVTVERFSAIEDAKMHFESVTSVEANTPYLFNITETGKKVFAAVNATVPVTALVEVSKGEYLFKGTFDKIEGANANSLYTLKSDGSGFQKANTTDTIQAYHAYIKYTGTNGASLLTIIHDDTSKPNLSKNDSELIMSGTWEPDDFNTKLDLSSDSITGVDMTGIIIPENAPALNAANPNMLIYTAEDAIVPDSWTNVVRGTSAGSITLKDSCPFYNSKEFTATVITYTRDYATPTTRVSFPSVWASGCLPFAVSALPIGVTAECFSDSQDTSVGFENISSLKANTPYLFNVTEAGKMTFTAANATIPATATISVSYGDYSFKGTFDKMEGADVNGLYLLKPDGTGFEKANTADTIFAYRAFIQYTGTDGASLLTIKHNNDGGGGDSGDGDGGGGDDSGGDGDGGTTSLENISGDKLVIRSLNGTLEINAPQSQQAKIYSLDGKIVKALMLSEGVNTVYGLAKGFYIINNQKIVIR